jgi:hypothetical protein
MARRLSRERIETGAPHRRLRSALACYIRPVLKLTAVGTMVGLAFLVAASPTNTLRCAPVTYETPSITDAPYEYDHSFAGIIAAARESDRRILLCGDNSMRPIARQQR